MRMRRAAAILFDLEKVCLLSRSLFEKCVISLTAAMVLKQRTFWTGAVNRQSHCKLMMSPLFRGNTEEGLRMKLGDWTLYCKLVYNGSIPKIREVQWPLPAECWVQFLLEARVRVSSYKRFQVVIGNVCEVANKILEQDFVCEERTR